jgi:hypothetical protein
MNRVAGSKKSMNALARAGTKVSQDDEHGEYAEHAEEGAGELDGRGDDGLLEVLVGGEHDAQRHEQMPDAKNLRTCTCAYRIQEIVHWV